MHNFDRVLHMQNNSIGPYIVNQKSDGKKKTAIGNNGAPSVSEKKRLSEAQLESESAIGSGLRSLYQEVLKEPLPDDILALLEKLGSLDSTDE